MLIPDAKYLSALTPATPRGLNVVIRIWFPTSLDILTTTQPWRTLATMHLNHLMKC